MNDKISVLHTRANPPELGSVLGATRSFTEAWQRGELKFQPVIHESLERHMKLFINCAEVMARNAQRVVAEIANDPLRDILDALEDGDDEDVLAIAGEVANTVKSLLATQVAHLGKEQQALATLAAPAWSRDEQRLLKQQQDQANLHTQVSAEHDREKHSQSAIEQAIATLEAQGLQTRFGGVVPSAQDLAKLAVPGAEAAAMADAVNTAVEQLQTLLGDVVEGMRYAQLQQERRAARERVANLARQVRELDQRQQVVSAQLAALLTMPRLHEQRIEWDAGINVVRQALANFVPRIGTAAPSNVAQVQALDDTFKQLLAYQRQLLEQHRRGL